MLKMDIINPKVTTITKQRVIVNEQRQEIKLNYENAQLIQSKSIRRSKWEQRIAEKKFYNSKMKDLNLII